MSRLFAEYLMTDRFDKKVDKDKLAEVFQKQKIEARYFKHAKTFQFKVLDFYGYVSDPSVPYFYNVKIEEPDLLRMLAVDTYSEDEKNELYYHQLLIEVEQAGLDDDTFWGISILQYFFHISEFTLVEIKRQKHLYDLYKVPVATYVLKQRQLHSKGGRKVGSLTGLTSADIQNFENREAIVRNCVEKDRFVEYMDLSRLLVRMRERTELGVLLTLTGAKWKFYIMRYQWKVKCGFKERDLEYEQKLVDKNCEYKLFKELNF